MTGYGIRPTSTISGKPKALIGASSSSACAGSPVWQMSSADSFMPEPSGA